MPNPVKRLGGISLIRVVTESTAFNLFALTLIIAFGAIAATTVLNGEFALTPTISSTQLMWWLVWAQLGELALDFLGSGPKRFFGNGWTVFDVTALCLAVIANQPVLGLLRLFRLMRALRLVSAAPQYRRLVEAAFNSISGILAFTMVLAFALALLGVLGVGLFRTSAPELFDDFRTAFVTLISIASLNAWDDPTVRSFLNNSAIAWAYVVFATILLHFVALGMAAAVVGDALHVTSGNAQDEETAGEIAALKDQLSELEAQLATKRRTENAGLPLPLP